MGTNVFDSEVLTIYYNVTEDEAPEFENFYPLDTTTIVFKEVDEEGDISDDEPNRRKKEKETR